MQRHCNTHAYTHALCIPVHSARKLLAVLGTTLSYRRKTMRPCFEPDVCIACSIEATMNE